MSKVVVWSKSLGSAMAIHMVADILMNCGVPVVDRRHG